MNSSMILYHNGFREEPFKTEYPQKVEVASIEEMKKVVAYDHVCAKYKNNFRKSDNYEQSNCIMLDVDNDHTELGEWKTVEDIRQTFPNVVFFVVYSRNNMKKKKDKTARPKFHIYFPIKNVTDSAEYKGLKECACQVFPFFDRNAKDIARFFYGVKEPKVEFYDGEILLTDFIKNNYSDLEKNAQNKDKDIIPEGQRNSTLNKKAVSLLKRYGDTENAKTRFLEEVEKCNPPLEHKEISTIYNSTVKFYNEKIREEEGYIEPKEYTKQKGKSEKKTQAELLLDIIAEKKILLFKDQYKQPYASIPIYSHCETYQIDSEQFNLWLYKEFYSSRGKPLGKEALTQTINTLKSKALFEGETKHLDVRMAEYDNAFWLDLVDLKWRAIRVNNEGWSIIENPPQLFSRYSHQRAQVEPNRNGDVNRILDYINLKGEETLFICYLISCFVPNIPKPMLILHGEKGAAKTTTMDFLKKIIDPSELETLALDKRSFIINISSHYYLGFDNVSKIDTDMSDMLCRAITGGALQQRKLYTNMEDVILNYKRSIVINGINNVANRADLLDRSLIIELRRISEGERKEIVKVKQDFKKDIPLILGGILDVLAKAISILPTAELKKLPRMADFAKWGFAIGEALGGKGQDFLKQYKDNIRKQNDEAINSDVVAVLLISFMQNREEYKGLMSELLCALAEIAPTQSINTNSKSFPSMPNALSRRLTDMKSNLEAVGITFETYSSSRGRHIILKNEKVYQPPQLSPYVINEKIVKPSQLPPYDEIVHSLDENKSKLHQQENVLIGTNCGDSGDSGGGVGENLEF